MTTRSALPQSFNHASRPSGASMPYRHDRTTAASSNTARASQSQQQSQQTSSEIHEYRCLFTSDLHQKKKRWKDGWVKHHVFNNRLMVYDLERNHASGCFLQADGDTVEEGWEGRVDDVLVEVGEFVRKEIQDLSKIFAKSQRSQASQQQTEPNAGQASGASISQRSMAPPPAPRIAVKPGGADSLKAVLARAKAKETRKGWLKTPLVGFDLPADTQPSPAAERAKRRKVDTAGTPRKQSQNDIHAATPAPTGRKTKKDVADRSQAAKAKAQKAGTPRAAKTPVNAPTQSSTITVSSDEDDSLFFPLAPRTYPIPPPVAPAPDTTVLLTTSSTAKRKGLLCAPQASRPTLVSTSANTSLQLGGTEPPISQSPSPPKQRKKLKFNPIPDPLASDSDEEPAFQTLASVRRDMQSKTKDVEKAATPTTLLATPPDPNDLDMMDLTFTPYVPSTSKPKAQPPQIGPWTAEAFFLFSKRELASIPDCKERLDALEKARQKD